MPVREITDEDLVSRAMKNLQNRGFGYAPAWAIVMETFGLGSTYAHELCRNHNIDPDKQIFGVICEACNDEEDEDSDDN